MANDENIISGRYEPRAKDSSGNLVEWVLVEHDKIYIKAKEGVPGCCQDIVNKIKAIDKIGDETVNRLTWKIKNGDAWVKIEDITADLKQARKIVFNLFDLDPTWRPMLGQKSNNPGSGSGPSI